MRSAQALALILCLLTGGVAQAQGASVTATAGMSQEDTKKLSESLSRLADAMNGAQQKRQATGTQAGMSMAEVADKALEMAGTAIAQTVEQLENVAPTVWRVMVRQQYAKAIGDLIPAWGLCLLFLIATTTLRSKQKKDWETEGWNQSNDEEGVHGAILVIGGLLMVLSGTFGIYALADSVKYFVNPEFYALKDLILILTGNGHLTG